jgi:hypothetical protein
MRRAPCGFFLFSGFFSGFFLFSGFCSGFFSGLCFGFCSGFCSGFFLFSPVQFAVFLLFLLLLQTVA